MYNEILEGSIMEYMLYSLKLERAFCAFGQSCSVSAGGFIDYFHETLRDGLNYLHALGVFAAEDKKILIERYTFQENKLEKILSDEQSKRKIDDLISQLHAFLKVYTER